MDGSNSQFAAYTLASVRKRRKSRELLKKAGGRSVLPWSAIAVGIVVLPVSFRGFNLPGNRQRDESVELVSYSHRLHAGELRIPCLLPLWRSLH